MNAISQTHFQLPQQTAFYRGKVRDVYTINNAYLVMVVSDRISAFDVVLPKPIPYKGQVLNQIAAKFLQATSHIVPNWVVAVPDPNVTIGKMCTPFKVEMVIRGYLAGHAYREYTQGKRTLCGITLPDGLKENDPFPAPIITPTTKESVGHDEDISKEKILEQGIVTSQDYEQLEKYTYALFKKGTEMASERGLILVDTKYEFGKTDDGKIYLIDEIHTPIPSPIAFYKRRLRRTPEEWKSKQLSKEFVREWLVQITQGKRTRNSRNDKIEIISNISERYINCMKKL